MKSFIKKRLREGIINNTNGVGLLCDKMSVATYEEGIKLIIAAIGTQDENPTMWEKIMKPLTMWKQENIQINREKHTTASGNITTDTTKGMSGDSMIDESNTWWAAIQSSLCQ